MTNIKQAAHQNRTLMAVVLIALVYAAWPHFDRHMLQYPGYQDVTGRAPYSNVRIDEVRREDDWLYLTFSFRKRDCWRRDVRFIGRRNGLTEYLHWEGLDGVPDDHSRLNGDQTVRGRMLVAGDPLDWIEVRTKHRCQGKYVQRTMMHLEGF